MVRRLKLFFDFDKEEAWLNRMASQGFLVRSAQGIYSFVPIPPGSAVVRIDYRPSMSQYDFADYVNLFQDAGWHHVSGSRHGGPQYFASCSAGPNVDIFSDPASKAQRYRRSLATSGLLLLPNLLLTFTTLSMVHLSSSPREWYYTPGLWEKQGTDFLRAFLVESIFVSLRVGAPIFMVAFSLCLVTAVAYQYRLFRKA
ncbi:DUF2812 domain-containing protein [Cryptosporangium sp. NPDC048952]|uniref:DUF2812 domain-containing protein n=1 Tax=Cryptosporangium sp. NPDC048952 TaxID=3363961 RepID=UPI0037209AD4